MSISIVPFWAITYTRAEREDTVGEQPTKGSELLKKSKEAFYDFTGKQMFPPPPLARAGFRPVVRRTIQLEMVIV